MNMRKPLSADRMFQRIREGMARIKEHRPMNVSIPLVDALMSGLALFALKDPSLLAFEKRREAPGNLRRIFRIEQIPSDTQSGMGSMTGVRPMAKSIEDAPKAISE